MTPVSRRIEYSDSTSRSGSRKPSRKEEARSSRRVECHREGCGLLVATTADCKLATDTRPDRVLVPYTNSSGTSCSKVPRGVHWRSCVPWFPNPGSSRSLMT